MKYEYGEQWWMMLTGENQKLGNTPVKEPFCTPQTPYG
jgi:hypothetical protein